MEKEKLTSTMVSELRRGTLTLVVLSHCHHQQYGYSLLQSLEESGVQVDASTLYPMLRRLNKQGVLDANWDTSDTRPRKYYVLSEYGLEIYKELKLEWVRLKEEMRFLEE